MSNFIKDNTALGAAKTDWTSRPDVPANQKLIAADWNEHRQFLSDIQIWLRGGDWFGLAVQSSNPAPVGLSTYVYADTNGALHLVSSAGDNQIGAETFLNVKDFGASSTWDPKTSSGADSRTAFTNAIAAAISSNKGVRIPAGTYYLSKYVLISGARGLTVRAEPGATIYYGSDTLTTVYDGTATSYNQARSAFYVKNSRDVKFDGLVFVGGTSSELSNINVGCGIYASRCVGLRVTNCTQRYGASLFQQDALADSTASSGNTLAVSSGVVTLTNDGDASYAFHAGMVNGLVTITNATNSVNNGIFQVVEVLSSTQLKFVNAAAVAESPSPLTFLVDDGDRDSKLVGCRWDGARAASYCAPHSSYESCVFERPRTHDRSGIPTSFSKPSAWASTTAYTVGRRVTNGGNTYECTVAGTSAGSGGPTTTATTIVDGSVAWTYIGSGTVMLMTVFGSVDGSLAGKYAIVSGSTSAGNNGTFKIVKASAATTTAPAKIQFANASGVTELAPQDTATWFVPNGEKSGLGNGVAAITNSSGVVTFTAASATFAAGDVDKALRLVSATSVGNRGSFVITRYVSATQVEFVNTSAVTEAFSGVFTVDGYDSRRGDSAVGPAISSTSTATSSTPSLTDGARSMVTNAYAGRYLTDSAGRQWKVVSNTGTVFTLAGTGTPASGAYTVTAAGTHGSSHGIYLFAGRTNVRMTGNTFRGVRTTAIKVSGSAAPIRDIEISGNTAQDCGAFAVIGADDSQDHSNISVHDNKITDCGTGRPGFTDTWGLGLLGARNVKVTNNQLTATREAVSMLSDGITVGGIYGIFAGRYVAGISQPLVDLTCDNNTLSIDASSCRAAKVAAAAIEIERVGQVAKTRTASGGSPISLTFDAVDNKVTLTDASAQFSQADVGSSIQLVNFAAGGNNVTATVTDVTGTGQLKFINATGVTVANSTVGTYRIKPKVLNLGTRMSTCVIRGNQISGYGGVGISTVSCTGPEITGNLFAGVGAAITDTGSTGPRIVGNREYGTTTANARIQLSSSTSWPFVSDNVVTNNNVHGNSTSIDGAFGSSRKDMGVSVDSTTAIDHPLLGKHGRCKSTGAKPEVVFSYGSEWVDGDTVEINGTTYTYKTTSPGAGQFNSQASLMALVGSGFVAEDYSTGLSGSLPTLGHIRMRTTATSASADLGYIWRINTLNPTTCVSLVNDVAGGENISYSRGEGIAGPLAKRFVIWSPACSQAGGVMVTPDESTAAALMSGGWYAEKASKNGGSNDVIRCVTTHAGTEEIRWTIV